MIGFAALHDELSAAYGPQQGWWPAEDAFEIMLGSILVQRTAWRNAALAIAQLRSYALLEPAALAAADPSMLAALIRSAGFFRAKSRRLRGLAAFVLRSGGAEALGQWPTGRLRTGLLELEGVGPETADAILLYAFGRPAVVVDEYLRRLVRRLGATAATGVTGATAASTDDRLRAAVAADLHDAPRLAEFHALVVEHGKRHCGSRPRCAGCPLGQRCAGSTLRVDPHARDAAAGPSQQIEIRSDDVLR